MAEIHKDLLLSHRERQNYIVCRKMGRTKDYVRKMRNSKCRRGFLTVSVLK